MRKFLIYSLGISIFFLWNCLGIAEEVQVSVSVDQDHVQVNEEIHLNVKITGIRGSIQAPQLPSLEGFDVFYSGRSSKFSFINGRSEAMTEFNYVLIAKMPGQFVLLPIEIKIGDKTYQTNQIKLTVEGAAAAPFPPPQRAPQMQRQSFPQRPTAMQGISHSGLQTVPMPPPPVASSSNPGKSGSEIDQNIFLKVVPSQMTIYTNQQLVLIYSLYTRYDTRYEGFVEEAETSGFWIEEFPMDPNIGKDTETINGKKFVRADVKKVALFPTAPGQYEIRPGVVKTSVQIEEPDNTMMDEFFRDSFFNTSGIFGKRIEKMLAPPTLRIQVKPLPEAGKPDSFKGAVGDFRMSTTVDKRVVNQNEAVTLQIALEGEGNIETLMAPIVPKIKDTKIYEADTQTQLFKAQNVIAGKKTFEIVIIPGEAGELAIPNVEFSFFNPKLERYVVLKSDSYKIKVTPSSTLPPPVPKEFMKAEDKKSIRVEAEDIQYIKERLLPNHGSTLKRFMLGLAVFDALFTLFFVALALIRRRNEYLDQNVSLKRTLFAKKFAARGLSRLNRLAKSSSQDNQSNESFFNESAKILNQYLSDKLNLSTHGLTQNMIEQGLRERNVSLEIIQKIQNCYSLCDQIRFGKWGTAGINREEIIQRIREIIYTLEQKGHD